MTSIHDTWLLPRRVADRMFPEHADYCLKAGIGVADVHFTPLGEQPQPNTLFLREPDRWRKNGYWYYCDVVGDVTKRHSTGCKADDLDGARAWVLTHMARKAERARSRVVPDNEPVCAAFTDYAKIVKGQVRRGEIRAHTGQNYLKSLKRLARCFKGATLHDVQAGGARKFVEWCELNGYSQNTAIDGNNVCKRAVNTVMKDRASSYRLDYRTGARVPKGKRPFNPDEIARIMDRVDDGKCYGPDLKPIMVRDEKTGEMAPKRCSREALLASIPFRTAVPFMLETATRKTAACEVTYTDPSGAFLDLDSGILHRRGMMTEDVKNKRRGSCVLSTAYLAYIRPIAEAAIAQGVIHLIHDRYGRPVKRLNGEIWRNILKDAQVPYRVIHCLKDTAIQIARVEGVPLYSAAERFATTPQTLVAHYGADWDVALQIDPAEAQGTRAKWLAMHAAAKERDERATKARVARESLGDTRQPKASRRKPARRKPMLVVLPGHASTPANVVPLMAPVADAQVAGVRMPLPGDAHDLIRLADRRPEGPRR